MSTFIKQIIGFLISRVAVRFATLISFMLVARILTGDGLGQYAVFTSTVFIAGFIGNLGLRQSSAHLLSKFPDKINQISGSLIFCTPILAIFTGLAAWHTMPDTAHGNIYNLLPALIICIAGSIMSMNGQGLYLAEGKISAFNGSEVAQRVSFLITILPFIALNPSSMIVIWIYSATNIFVGLAIFVHATSSHRPIFNVKLCISLIYRGIPYGLALGLIMLNSRIGVLMTSKYDPVQGGSFFAALRIFDVSQEIPSAVGLILFSNLLRSKDTSREAKKIFYSVGSVFVISIFVSIVLMLFRNSIDLFIIGRNQDGFAESVIALAIALPFASIGKVLYPAIAGIGRPMLGAGVYALAIIVNYGVNRMLIPQFGMVGASWGLVASQIIAAILLFILAVLRFDVAKKIMRRIKS